jgi:putative sigma-54 modulation protein
VKVVLHDRTDGLPPELREYAQGKLSRLARHFGKVAEAEVDFTEERKRSGHSTAVCRIKVLLDGRRVPVLTAHESGPDAQSALDLALDKIDRQVVKTKEKRTHRKMTALPLRAPQPRDDTKDSSEPERIHLKLRPMSVEDAVSELESDDQAFHVFLDENSGGIQIAFRRADGSVGIIEPTIP